MPKYRVKELSLIGNELFQAGAEVEYDGLPAENLEPLDDEGRAKAAEYVLSNEARVKQMMLENSDSQVGDPAAFATAVAAVLKGLFADGLISATGTARKKTDSLV